MISVVITAAGCSTRFGENKLLSDIGGKMLIVRTLEQFSKANVDEIVVATQRKDIEFYEKLFSENGLKVKVVEGGGNRIESVLNGVKSCSGDVVITHDGARPLTPVWLIQDLIKAVEENGAAMTAVPPVATIKYAEDDMMIQRSLARKTTWIAQTPQGFKREILLSCFEKAINDKYFVATDDSEIVAMNGHKVKVVPGDYINMKVTVKSDLAIVRELFRQKDE